jgi:serine/threonine protein kinase
MVLARDAATPPPPVHGDNPLPIGHKLQEYVIEGLIGEGGFGIVYLARDTQLGRVVALKEYMPSSLASRANGGVVSVRSERQRETFELGRRSFVNEAQLLAAFDQPSLVKVYRFWEQNGTAYMVMPYYQGPTLKQWLLEHGSPSESWLLALLAPVIDALEVMHHNRCYHRDIAPDNILLLQQQGTQVGGTDAVRPVLLDFGAARRVISDATQALTVILKPGYAPIEQYAESSSMKQGAWTDVYALCAVLYAAVTGRAPTPSVSRIVSDELVPAVEAGAGRFTPEFLAVIDAGLAVRPEHRPQDMAALRAMITSVSPPVARRASDRGGERSAPLPLVDLPPPPAPKPPPSDGFFDKTVVVDRPDSRPAPLSAPAPLASPAPSPAPALSASSKTPLVAGGAVALLLAAGGAWWAMSPKPQPPAPAPVVAATPAPAPAPVAPPPPAPAPPPAEPFTVVAGLQDIVRHADPLLGVNVLADKSSLTIGRDRLQFRVKSKEAGYLYVFLSGTDKSHFYLLFPNEIDKNNRIEANTEVALPRKSWAITAGGPAGTNHIVTVVSRRPRDLGAVGLRGAGDEIPEFDLAKAEQLWAARQPGESPFVGKAVCDAGAACDSGYGASLLEVDEVARGK